jgi:hypothetical protein
VVTIPHEDTTEYTYTGEEITYGIPESDYYTIIGATQVEAGKYVVTLKLNDTANTVWQNNSRNDLTYVFVIGGDSGALTEQPIYWLEAVLGVALLSIFIWLIVLAKKKKKNKQENQAKALVPFGLVLATTVPTWEYYLIIALAVIVLVMLILALALTHSYFKKRRKQRELEEKAELVETEGLAYELAEDGKHYVVAGMGNCTATKIVFASTVNGLPVTEVKQNAFADCKAIKSVAMPSSIVKIGEGAFKGCKGLQNASIRGDGSWTANREKKQYALKKAFKDTNRTAEALTKTYCNYTWLREED